MIKICKDWFGKSFSTVYGSHSATPMLLHHVVDTVEPQFNDLRFNDIPGLTMGILFPERKSFPV